MSDLATQLQDYEVSQAPVMAGSRLDWQPWVSMAVTPYQVTRLPHVTVHGLWDAMRRAEVERGGGQEAVEEPPAPRSNVVVLDDRRSQRRGSLLVAMH
jgi:hypothetical protein